MNSRGCVKLFLWKLEALILLILKFLDVYEGCTEFKDIIRFLFLIRSIILNVLTNELKRISLKLKFAFNIRFNAYFIRLICYALLLNFKYNYKKKYNKIISNLPKNQYIQIIGLV